MQTPTAMGSVDAMNDLRASAIPVVVTGVAEDAEDAGAVACEMSAVGHFAKPVSVERYWRCSRSDSAPQVSRKVRTKSSSCTLQKSFGSCLVSRHTSPTARGSVKNARPRYIPSCDSGEYFTQKQSSRSSSRSRNAMRYALSVATKQSFFWQGWRVDALPSAQMNPFCS